MKWPDNNPIADLLAAETERGGPMYTVRLSALRRPDTPITVRVGWPMPEGGGAWAREPDLDRYRDERDPVLGTVVARHRTVTASSCSRPSDSLIQCCAAWWSVAQLEGWITEAAWHLGAGYFARWSQPPGRDPEAMGSGLGHDFGTLGWEVMGHRDALGRCAPSDVVAEAARDGWWTWEHNIGYRQAEIGSMSARRALLWLAEAAACRDADGGRSAEWPGWDPEDPKGWIAPMYETTDEPGHVLGVGRDFTTRRVSRRCI